MRPHICLHQRNSSDLLAKATKRSRDKARAKFWGKTNDAVQHPRVATSSLRRLIALPCRFRSDCRLHHGLNLSTVCPRLVPYPPSTARCHGNSTFDSNRDPRKG